MWRLFKFNRSVDTSNESDTSARDRIAVTIATRLLLIQKHWSAFMQRGFERLTPGMKKFTLFCFMLTGVLICGYWLWTGATLKSVRVAPRTKSITFRPQLIQEPPVVFNPELYRKLQYIRKYLDTTTAEGRNLRARLNRERPGLLDSIAFIERAYEKYNKY